MSKGKLQLTLINIYENFFEWIIIPTFRFFSPSKQNGSLWLVWLRFKNENQQSAALLNRKFINFPRNLGSSKQ